MLYLDIVSLIYVNETICMVICLSTRFKFIVLWPGMTHLVSRLSQNISYGWGAWCHSPSFKTFLSFINIVLAKSKGEKERYSHLNAGFQRIARRDKKAFLSDQCKEIEENNRMRKARDLFKKVIDTKGTIHVNMGSIKDRNGMDLTEADNIKKRWQEYTEELYKKRSSEPR